MRVPRLVYVGAGVLGALALLWWIQQNGRQLEQLQHRTDSLNVAVAAYRADSAARQRSIDSALAASASAESAAVRSGQQAAKYKQQRDSMIAAVRADTGAVPRVAFEAIVAADSATIRHQELQIDSLGSAMTSLRAAFNTSDAARTRADSILTGMTTNRDQWRSEAKRANRIGLVVSFAYALPSGQWQATVGIGKRIRLPRLLGG